MTTEQKAKAYDEAIERASKLRVQNPFDTVSQMMEHVFPELCESEDERIRKELIEHVKDQQSSFISAPDCRDKYEEEENNKYNSWLSWLEKQGEQKPSTEVKPKFKVGDWVVFNDKHESVYQIEKIENFQYTLRHILGGSMPLSFSGEDVIRPWAIQDAKDGDVLACNEEILLFKSYSVQGRISLYCWYNGQTNNFHSKEVVDTLMTTRNKIYPATKEQRDILFQKIKEAGYEWDENNKMLKEIVEDEEEPQNYKNQIMSEITDLVKHYIKQKPTCGEAGEDMKEALRTEYEKGRADAFSLMQKEWSEEDEVKINRIVACLENLNVADNDILLKDVDWLKAIKDRYSWKPSSELDETSYQVGIKRVLENPESYGLTKYNWKPSDKQMHAFEQVYDWYNNNFAPSETLTSLYKDLEKLKGE